MTPETCPLSIADIQSELEYIREKAAKGINRKVLEQLLSFIDLNTLNPTDTISSVLAFTEKVNSFPQAYPGLGNVAAICIYPNLAETVRQKLSDSSVNICAVAGGFPASMTFSSLKIEEARMAVAAGANEIDIVIPLWAFLDGDFQTVSDEISAIKKAIGNAHLKVILETGVLDIDQIWQASVLAIESGADFIKTSTGKLPQAASPEAAFVMCLAIRQHFEETGKMVGFKAAGGIVSPEDAHLYFLIVQEILGKEWLTAAYFRIGASRLANNLLEKITGHETKHS